MESYIKPEMPDVAATQPAQQDGTLDWVGMSRIALPLTIKDRDAGLHQVSSFVETYVNLINPQVKGIHMSRLYLLLADFAKEGTLTIETLCEFLREKLASHEDISDTACLRINFDYFIKQPALKSEYSGWKDYPVTLQAVYSDGRSLSILW